MQVREVAQVRPVSQSVAAEQGRPGGHRPQEEAGPQGGQEGQGEEEAVVTLHALLCWS